MIKRNNVRNKLWRYLLCLIMPPLAVVDKGINNFIIVLILTVIGWIPGVIGAIIISNKR
jgi:uncharacterized membrane protein YqaE (UPF0057 family)